MSNGFKQLKRFIAVSALLFAGAATAFCQTPTLQWQKTYGSRLDQEFGYASAKLNNNLYVHGGRSIPVSRNSGTFLLFTNGQGDSLYSVTNFTMLGGKITGMAANDDGTFVACGSYFDATMQDNLFLIKFNQLGSVIWQRDFPGLMGDYQKVIRLPDGYLLVTSNQATFVKIDLSGNHQWTKRYGQALNTGGQDIIALPDGSYLATGWSTRGGSATVSSFHKLNYWLLKLRPNGDTIITKIRGNPNNFEIGYAASPTSDGGVAVAGAYVANISQTKRQGQVLKLDSLLNLQWELKVMPKIGDYEIGCEFFNIQPTFNGGFVASGSNSDSIGYNGSIVLINSVGVKQWEQQYMRNSISEVFYSMLYEADGTALLTGTKGGYYSGSNFIFDHYLVKLQGLPLPYKPDFCAKPPVSSYSYLVKLDSIVITNSYKSKAGTRYGVISKWEYLFGDGNSFITYDSLVAKRVAHKYAFGTAFMYGNPVKLIVTNNTFCTDTLTLYPFGGAPTGITEATAATVEVKLYPNPMQQQSILELKNYTGSEKLQLEVTDMLGRKVAMPNKQLKANQWQLQRGNLSKGLYVYRLVAKDRVVAQGKVFIND